MFFSIIAQVYYGRNKTMFDKDGVNQLQVYKNAWEQFKVSVVDFYGTQRTAKAQKMLNIDVAELNDAVKAFESLKAANANMLDSDAKADAIAQSFYNASSAARAYAESNELTAESVGKFKAKQEAAITAIEKGSLASKAASLATGLLTGALASLGVAVVSALLNKAWDMIDYYIHKQERLAEATTALRDEYKSLESEISSLSSELKSIDDRINELNGKSLTITEQGELEQLQAQRSELERILEIKQLLAKEKKEEAAGKAVEYFQNEYHYNDMYGDAKKGTIIDETQYDIEALKDLQQQISDARIQLKKYADEFGTTSPQYKEVEANLENLGGSYDNLKKKIAENIEEMTQQRESLDITKESHKALIEQMDQQVAQYNRINGDIGESYNHLIQNNGFEGLDKQLQRMAQAGTLTADYVRQYENLTAAAEKYGFTVDDIVEHQYALAESAKKVAPPPIDLTSMEGLKTKLSEIIDKANVLSEMDLNQAALSGGTDKQKEAWAELQSLMATYGISLEDVQEKIVEFGLVGADGASKITQAFIDANQNSAVFASNLSQITNRTDTLVNAYKELAKGQRLSSDVIMNLIQAYPKLETELTEYLAGLRSQQQIMLDLEAVYQADSENWKALMLAKLANSETFWESVLLNNAEWVTQFRENYGIDLSNCKSYAAAKLQVMSALTTAMETMAGRTNKVQEDTGAIITERNHNVEQASGAAAGSVDLLQQALNELNNISMGGLEGQFQSLNSAIDSTTSKANEAASALRSIASTSLSAINGLLDMTMSMLKQDLTTQKEDIESQLDGLKADYDATKNQLEADKKAALNDIEAQRKALQAKKKAQDKAYDDQIKHLQKVKDAQNDIYDDQIKAAEDELDAYNKIIDAQLKLLRLKEEQHDYERELADKQKGVADLEAKLAELGLDDSIEAQKKRLELEEELAAKKDELDEFQHDKNISDQEQALEDEKEAFEEKQQAIIDGIQAQKDAYNEMIDAQIEGIREAKEAFDESIQAQLDALADQKDQTQAYYDAQLALEQRNYEADRASREQRKAELDKQINDTAALRKQAIELIEGRSEEFYNRLIAWNRQYGTGIDADVDMKWKNAYKALETFGGKQFDVLSVMNDLTKAGDGFTHSLEEAIAKAGDLEIALRNAVNAQAGLQFAKTYDEHRVSGGQLSTFKPSKKGAKYHDGGEVGKDNVYSAKEFTRFMDNLKTDEVPAVLKKKEWVLTEEQQGNILNLTNTQKEIIGAFERMYKAVSSGISNMPTTGSTSLLDLPSIPELATAGGDNTAVFNFNTTITGNADDDVMDNWFSKNVSAFEDRFARYTLGQVNFKRNIRTKR